MDRSPEHNDPLQGARGEGRDRLLELLEQAEAISHVGTWEIDLLTGANWWSDELFRISGIQPGSVVPTTELGLQVIHPEDRDKATRIVAEAMERGVPYEMQNRVLHPDGTVRHVLARSRVITNEEGVPIKLMGIVQDVTDRVERNKAFAERNEMLESAEVLGRMGTWELHLDTGRMAWSDEHARLCGYVPGDRVPDLTFLLERLVHADDVHRAKAMLDDLHKGIPYEGVLRYRSAEGSTLHVQVKARLVEGHNGDASRVMGVVRDITAEVMREQELLRMRAEQEALVNSTSDLIWSVGRDYRLIAVNQAFAAMVVAITGRGVRPGDHALIPALGEKLGKAWMDSYQRALAGEQITTTMDLELPDGNRVGSQISFNPILRHGEVHGVACYAKDITKEMWALQALVESEARYRGLFRDSPVPMIVYDMDSLRIRDVNNAACKHYGRGRKEFLERTVKELLPHGERAFPANDAMHAEGGGQGHFGVMQHQRKDGTVMRVDVHAYPILFEGQSCMMLACLDVTERERWTERLARSEADLRQAQETARLGMWKLETTTGVLHWSDMVYSIWERPTTDKPTLDEFFESVHPEDRTELENTKDLLINGVGPQEHVHRIVLPGGRIKWVYQKAHLMQEEGVPVVHGIVQDITGQREMEDLLQRATRLARVGSWEMDLRTNELYWSPMTREIFEVGPDHVPQLDSAIQAYKDDGSRALITEVVGKAVTEGIPWDVEVVMITTSGKERWVRTIGHAEFVDGKAVRLHGSIQDIHAQKMAEQARSEAQQEREKLLGRIGDAFIGLDASWKVTYWNPVAERMLGRTKEDMLGTHLWERYPEAHTFRAHYERAMETQEVCQFEEFHHDTGKWFEVNAYPAPDGLSVFFRDVTERHHMRTERERMAQVLDRSLNEVFIFDALSLRFTYINKGALLNTGYTMEEMRSMTPLDLKPDHTPESFARLLAPLRDGASDQVRFETFHRRKDGSTYPVEVHLQLDRTGTAPSFVAMILDTSQRDRMREEMQRSNERFLLVSKATEDVIWDWDILADRMDRTETFMALLGGAQVPQASGAEHWYRIIHADDRQRVRESIQVLMEDPERSHWHAEYRLLRRHGGHAHIVDRGVMLRNAKGRPVRMVGAMQDITARKEQEERLKKLVDDLAESNQELEQFAFVASHDLQEPLRMVTSFLTRLESHSASKLDDRALGYLQQAVDGAYRMRQVIIDLLEYSRAGRDDGEMEPVDLDRVMEEVKDTLAVALAEQRATLRWTHMPVVDGARNALVRVLQNLVSNAIKYSRPGVPPNVEVSATAREDLWIISVHDNGIGIDSQYHERIFEVFQRLHTKDRASGNGIGLSICRKIVEAHGGRIWVSSEAGIGSTFRFTLPRSAPVEVR